MRRSAALKEWLRLFNRHLVLRNALKNLPWRRPHLKLVIELLKDVPVALRCCLVPLVSCQGVDACFILKRGLFSGILLRKPLVVYHLNPIRFHSPYMAEVVSRRERVKPAGILKTLWTEIPKALWT